MMENTKYTATESEIRTITEEEANKLAKSWDFMLDQRHEPWGGLFLYMSKDRKHPRKPIWIAIDDTSGQHFIKEFKKRRKAIEWLTHPAGPKKVRL